MDNLKQTLHTKSLLYSTNKEPQAVRAGNPRPAFLRLALFCCPKSCWPVAWNMASVSQTPLSWCKQSNVNNCKTWWWNPRTHGSKPVVLTKGFSKWRRIYWWYTGKPSTKREQRAVLLLVLTKALVTIFLPTIFIPTISMLLKLLISGFYGEDTSTLLVPRYSYWKIYILLCLTLEKKPSQSTRNSEVSHNIPVPNWVRNQKCKHVLSDNMQILHLSNEKPTHPPHPTPRNPKH